MVVKQGYRSAVLNWPTIAHAQDPASNSVVIYLIYICMRISTAAKTPGQIPVNGRGLSYDWQPPERDSAFSIQGH
jgi:hypothetical protein